MLPKIDKQRWKWKIVGNKYIQINSKNHQIAAQKKNTQTGIWFLFHFFSFNFYHHHPKTHCLTIIVQTVNDNIITFWFWYLIDDVFHLLFSLSPVITVCVIVCVCVFENGFKWKVCIQKMKQRRCFDSQSAMTCSSESHRISNRWFVRLFLVLIYFCSYFWQSTIIFNHSKR